MTEQNSKAKYSKFLKSPKWNEAVFSPEGYLVTLTNLDPKDDRSFYHKQQEILLDLAWVTSPEKGTLLCGTRSGNDLVDIKFLDKPDDKWIVNETKTKEAESKFKEHGLIAIHTTEDECLPLYTLSTKLVEHKIVIDTGAGLLVDVSKDSNFNRDKFSTAFDKLVTFLLGDSTKIFDDFQDVDEEAYTTLVLMGSECNLITKTALRKGKWTIPGIDAVPQWTTLTYTKPDAVDEVGKGSAGSGQRRAVVTPKQKLEALVGLLTEADSPLLALQAASNRLGYTLTPQELLSLAVGAAIGCYVPFGSSASGTGTATSPLLLVEDPKLPSTATDTATATDSASLDSDALDSLDALVDTIQRHPKWNPKNSKVKKMVMLDYGIEMSQSQLSELDTESLTSLLSDLDTI